MSNKNKVGGGFGEAIRSTVRTGAQLLSLLLALVVLSSCAPGLRERLSVSRITAPARLDLVTKTPIRARVIGFKDSRPSATVAVINGREVEPEENVAEVVQQSFEGYLRSEGIQPVLFDAPGAVAGEIDLWQITVKPAFPASELTARAAVRVTVSNEKDEVVYRGSFTGETSKKHPFAGEDVVSSTLGEAMGAALAEAARDDRLQAALQSRP